MEKEPPVELVAFLTRYPSDVVETMLTAREMLHGLIPDASENILSVSYTVSCGYTFTHSIKQAFLYLAAFKGHVNIGFVDGSALSDPARKLIGDGKSMRHIKIRNAAELDDPAAAALILQAADQAYRPDPSLPPITMVSPKPKK